MASISSGENGNLTIQFVGRDGRRRSIRLGKMPLTAARELKMRFELLHSANLDGLAIDSCTAEWLGRLDATLYDRLASVQLVPAREATSGSALGAWLDTYIAQRSDVKPSTVIV